MYTFIHIFDNSMNQKLNYSETPLKKNYNKDIPLKEKPKRESSKEAKIKLLASSFLGALLSLGSMVDNLAKHSKIPVIVDNSVPIIKNSEKIPNKIEKLTQREQLLQKLNSQLLEGKIVSNKDPSVSSQQLLGILLDPKFPIETLEVLTSLPGGEFQQIEVPSIHRHSNGNNSLHPLGLAIDTSGGIFQGKKFSNIAAHEGDKHSQKALKALAIKIQKTGKVYQILTSSVIAKQLREIPGLQAAKNKGTTENIRIGTTEDKTTPRGRHEEHYHIETKNPENERGDLKYNTHAPPDFEDVTLPKEYKNSPFYHPGKIVESPQVK